MGHSWIDAETRAELWEVLDRVAEWQLPVDRWSRLAEILDAATSAVDSYDIVALKAALLRFHTAGPIKATRIGATPVLPMPEPVMERRNELVHRLGPPRPVDYPPAKESDDPPAAG